MIVVDDVVAVDVVDVVDDNVVVVDVVDNNVVAVVVVDDVYYGVVVVKTTFSNHEGHLLVNLSCC